MSHERLVDLDRLGRQAFQVTQRRVTGAEIVQRKAHAQRTTGIQAAADVLQVVDSH